MTATAGAAGTQRRRRDTDEVLSAAARVFYARGYADASMQSIADELGLLKGSLYHYVTSKEELLFRLLDGMHTDVGRILEEVRAENGLAPLERLRLYVRRQVAYSLAHPERVAVYRRELERVSPERRVAIDARRAVHHHFVADLIAAAQAAGDATPEPGAALLSCFVFGTMTNSSYRPGRDDPEELAEVAARYAVGGVTARR